jgi:hypothetical protein
VVGKADSSYKGCYVLYGTDPVVYRASANLKSLIGFTAEDFRSRKPWQFEPATATKVLYRPATGAPVEFTKQGEFWTFGGGKNASQNLLKETVKKLAEVTVNSYVDSPDPAIAKIAAAPVLEVTANNGVYKVSLGAPESSTLYVQDQDGFVYKASEYSMKFLSELTLPLLTADDTKKDEAKQAAAGGPPGAGLPMGATPATPSTPAIPPKAAVPPKAPVEPKTGK